MRKYLSLFILLCLPTMAFGFGVDLHAHLFMEKGVKLIYSGGFWLPYIKAKKWNDSRKSQVNEDLLKKSDLDIVVVSLYAAPVLAGSSMFKSILKQIDMAELFVKRNPQWVIASTSEQARAAIAAGKKVLVLSIEGAEYFVNTLSQLKLLYSRGVRIITLLHLTRDRIGAPAFLGTSEAIFSTPGAYWFCYNRDRNYVKVNCSGLTSHGEQVAEMLMDAGVWIDLSHASDKALGYLIPKHYQRNIPLMFTHATLRSKLKQERGVSEETMGHYRKLGGVFGLVPSKKLLGQTTACQGTIDAFKEHFDLLTSFLDPDQIAVGTDTNGMLLHLKPRFEHWPCNTERRRTEFDKNGGWWNFSHTMPLYQELKSMGAPVAEPSAIVQRFLNEWSRIEKASRPERVWGDNSPYASLVR